MLLMLAMYASRLDERLAVIAEAVAEAVAAAVLSPEASGEFLPMSGAPCMPCKLWECCVLLASEAGSA